ncbi:MAG TPA: NAD-dependent malic enzyme [Elusimicrobia bacterium]|nr:NAD-dependent malic enzyme [Elusimicrobiota bacterium]
MIGHTERKAAHDELIRPNRRGIDILHDPDINKGTAFTYEERERLGLEGFLPDHVTTIEEQSQRAMENFHKAADDLARYVFLTGLQDRNQTLFYRVVIDNIREIMPIIYTPVVGLACQNYAHIFRRPRGLYVTTRHRGRMREVLRNWPEKDVRVIVVTDGERILGLGDLGANGMGIPIGKLSLYTGCAGVPPEQTLPILLDVGTNNESLLKDPLYIGVRKKRITGADYDEMVDEFIQAVQEVFPKALLQFEDFANHTAFRLLAKYRDEICTFNDDIQGTAGVTLAGFYSAMRLTKAKLKDQTILFFGAGEAAAGIAQLVMSATQAEGLSRKAAAERCWFVDSKGLVESGRKDLAEHKKPFAHKHAPAKDLLSALKAIKPTILVGASGQPRTFTQEVVGEMSRLNARPVIFALSNPTSKAECTAQEAYTWSKGKAVFASGSPFPPAVYEGQTFVSGQSNNAYVFPGVGLGIAACGATAVTDEMFFESARVLADMATEKDLAQGCLFPPLTRIREASALIAAATAEVAYKRGLATEPRPKDMLAFVKSKQYQPVYKRYI